MAIVQNPVTGRSRNAFANAVFTTLLGKNVMRSKPLEVSNPRSPKQVAARERLAMLSKLSKQYDYWVQRGYQNTAIGMYPRNKFVKENLQTVTVDAGGVIELHPQELKLSKGNLYPEPAITGMSLVPGTSCTVFFNPGTSESNPNVKTYFVVVNPATLEVIASKEVNGLHANGTISVTNSALTAGQYGVIFAYDTVTGNATDTATFELA